jgi:1-acyl-sn-glycerol-3-phosphate acyltransferase
VEETSRMVRAWRLLRLALHLANALLIAAVVLPWAGPARRQRFIRSWSQTLLNLLGVTLTLRGAAPDSATRNVMVVANHVSWLDIYLLNAVRPVRFISKSEVRSWPVVGWLADKTGTLFVEREKRRDTVRVNGIAAAALAGGDCMALFPEGTTTDGSELRPFLASLLQPAIDAGAMLQPVALRYLLPDGRIDSAPAYFGDMSLGQSLAKVVSRPEIRAELTFLDPLPCADVHRRALARQAEGVISDALNLAVPRTTPETPACPPVARP